MQRNRLPKFSTRIKNNPLTYFLNYIFRDLVTDEYYGLITKLYFDYLDDKIIETDLKTEFKNIFIKFFKESKDRKFLIRMSKVNYIF